MTNYNLTILQNSENLVDIAITANTYTNGLMSLAFILAIFIIMVAANYDKLDFSSNITVASFVCFILSSLLTYAELLTIMIPIIFLMLLVFGGLYLYIKK